MISIWMEQNDDMNGRDVFIAGDMEDSEGGQYLFEVARSIHVHAYATGRFHLKGIVAGNSQYTPVMRFVSHRSFESNNNMTFWTVNRARQDIVCNGFYSEVEFLMNDVHLRYTPKDISSTGNSRHSRQYVYELVSVSSPDKSYQNIDEFNDEWSNRQLPEGTSTDPRVQNPETFASDIVFPISGKQQTLSSLPQWLINMMDDGVKVVLYNSVQKSSQAICNFYIGIYESDSTKYHIDPNTHSSVARQYLEQYNAATLEEISAVSSSSDLSGMSIAWLQDGMSFFSAAPETISSSTSLSKSGGGIVWMQLDDRFVPELTPVPIVDDKSVSNYRMRKPEFGYFNKAAAVEILAHVLGKQHPSGGGEVIDFIDLLV